MAKKSNAAKRGDNRKLLSNDVCKIKNLKMLQFSCPDASLCKNLLYISKSQYFLFVAEELTVHFFLYMAFDKPVNPAKMFYFHSNVWLHTETTVVFFFSQVFSYTPTSLVSEIELSQEIALLICWVHYGYNVI